MNRRKLPNGFGQISKLSGRRSRPYMARLPDRKVLGYAETYEDAYLILAEYNKRPWDIDARALTIEDLWQVFLKTKFKNYAKNTQSNFKTSYNYLSPLANKPYAAYKTHHFEMFLDSLECSDNVKNNIIKLLKHIDDIAYQLDVIDKKYAYGIMSRRVERRSERRPFSEEEIETLWQHVDEPFIDYIIIMIYTGFRINEFIKLRDKDFNLDEWTITGGSKTEAGKNRVVPIHPRIRPLVLKHLGDDDFYPFTENTFRQNFYKALERLGMSHLPHECRHTLRSRLDSAGANKACIDKILGHKSGDTGIDIYTHKTVKELMTAIKSIK